MESFSPRDELHRASIANSSTGPGATSYCPDTALTTRDAAERNGHEKDRSCSESYQPVEMDRKDSGFAEISEAVLWQRQEKKQRRGTFEDERVVSPRTSLTPKPRNPSDVGGQDPTRCSLSRLRTSTTLSRSQSYDYRFSNSASSHRTNSRRSSVSRTSQIHHQTSRPSLLHSQSSFRSQSMIPSHVRPIISLRTTSASTVQGHARDPITMHHESCRLFSSLSAHRTSPKYRSAANSTHDLMSPSITSLRRSSSINYESIPPVLKGHHTTTDDAKDLEHGSLSHEHIPPTIIDWTSPSTRRREYEKIDKSRRGFRGWWRRFAPRWCSNTSRAGFYEGDDDDNDAGSVRRYRIDIQDDDENENENKEMAVKVSEMEERPSLRLAQRSWSCF